LLNPAEHSTLLNSLAETEPREITTGYLLALLFAGSVFVWGELFKRQSVEKSFLTLNEEPRARWNSIPELLVVFLTVFVLSLSLILRFLQTSAEEHPPVSLNSLVHHILFNLSLSLILSFALVSNDRPWSGIGMRIDHSLEQLKLGVYGFFAAVIPMTISMFATLPFRGAENQHSLLKQLTESPDVTTITVIGVTAVIAAPVFEELLYRVILQGWLSTIFSASVAIPLTAVLFASVHGWRDGLALLPLALILGYVFHRQHSYLSVVVIHALFNATMLTLQLLNPSPT
jgi:uncharacterized protein